MPPRLYLLDGTALVYRAYYALHRNPLVNSRGEPTGAIFGFAQSLLTLARQEKPEYMAVVLDAPGPTFRDEMYTEYKANRSPMPDDLGSQQPWIRELIDAWPCARVEVSGVEADDVMGSYANQLAGPDLDVVLVTSDKDMYQVLSEHVRILNPGRGGPSAIPQTQIEVRDIPKKFGVERSEQVIDVLALMGDTSDNVPGVPGIGPKTAGKLIHEHGSLENIYEDVARVASARTRDRLVEHEGDARRARELVTIRTNLDLPLGLEEMRRHKPGGEALVTLLERLEFRNLIAELGLEEGPQLVLEPHSAPAATSCRLVDDLKTLKQAASALRRTEDGFAFRVECTEGPVMRAAPVGLALATAEETFYVNVAHTGGTPLGPLVAKHLGPVLGDPDVTKVAHDAKPGMIVMERAGMPVRGLTFDTMVASYVLNPERSHRLGSLALNLLGSKIADMTDLIGKGAKATPLAEADPGEAGRIAGDSAAAMLELRDHFAEQLGPVSELFRAVEMPLVDVLVAMERHGVAVDTKFLQEMGKRLETELKRLEARCLELADTEFNVNSPHQLADVLFVRLALPKGKKTKTGYSTDSEVLEKLRVHHDLPGVVLEYRQIAKLKSTYVDALPVMVNTDTGRIHATFNQTVAATGRLSSSDPNLQNIPVRTELGREVRRAFVPGEPGWVLCSADYSQIELRIMAHLSRDPLFLESFQNNVDIHRSTAALLFGVEPEQVTDVQRGQAKTVNFGILYGQGPFGLARTLGISNREASDFIKLYKAQFAGVVGYLESTLERARRDGYVSTLLGRRRFLPNLRARGGPARAAAERLAINTPIQGSAADLIKVAMIRLHRQLRLDERESRLVLQVHDELLLECPRSEAEVVSQLVREVMEGAIDLEVPVVVNVGVGADWAEIH